jgi:hypothetical protein
MRSSGGEWSGISPKKSFVLCHLADISAEKSFHSQKHRKSI